MKKLLIMSFTLAVSFTQFNHCLPNMPFTGISGVTILGLNYMAQKWCNTVAKQQISKNSTGDQTADEKSSQQFTQNLQQSNNKIQSIGWSLIIIQVLEYAYAYLRK